MGFCHVSMYFPEEKKSETKLTAGVLKKDPQTHKRRISLKREDFFENSHPVLFCLIKKVFFLTFCVSLDLCTSLISELLAAVVARASVFGCMSAFLAVPTIINE